MLDIGVAVVGAGFIGPVHVEALRRLGLPVRGILGCDQAESDRAARNLGLPKAYASLDEVLADPGVQAVHLAVPNVLHYEFAKRAIGAGKHVMCEKPLAMNAAESAELVELAKGKRLAAGVCYNVRFYPLNLEARERIAAGRAGPDLLPSTAATSRTGCSTRPTTTGACWPTRGASFGPWPTSARTGWTWSARSPAWRSRPCWPT